MSPNPFSDIPFRNGRHSPRETDATGPVGMSRERPAADRRDLDLLAADVVAAGGSQILWFESAAPLSPMDEALSSSAEPWSRTSIETDAEPIPWLLVLPSFSGGWPATAFITSSADLLRPFCCCCWYNFHVSTFSMLLRARSGDPAALPVPFVPPPGRPRVADLFLAPSSATRRWCPSD